MLVGCSSQGLIDRVYYRHYNSTLGRLLPVPQSSLSGCEKSVATDPRYLRGKMELRPIILAGGSGTRLWPLSREFFPKQLLSLGGEGSMFQETLRRLDGIDDASSPIVVCNEAHRFLVAEHAGQMGVSLRSIILEPAGRNTAPALTLAGLAVTDSGNGTSDPVMLVLPSDHIIRDVAAFQSVVRRGASLADDGFLVTFGIVPKAPDTRYGYIEQGQPVGLERRGRREIEGVESFEVTAFVEKPDEATARKMLDSQSYLWNSGIFMMRASVWLEQLELHRPDIAESCRAAYASGRKDGDFYRPDLELFEACPSDSIDYAVMEKVMEAASARAGAGPGKRSESYPQCVVLPLDAGWSDLGAWPALLEEGDRDPQGNVVQGDVRTHSVRNSLLIGQHRLVAAVGLEDVIVVETADAVLVAHKDRVQDIKELVAELKADGRPEHEDHRKVHRPWGTYEIVDAGPGFQVKRLTVNAGQSLSLQMHHHRAEHWVVVAGTAKVTRGDEEFLLTENQSTNVPLGVKHRLENPGTIPLEIIEVGSGSYMGADDIIRFDDRYRRHMS